MSEPSKVASRRFKGEDCPLVIVGAWQLSSGHSARTDGLLLSESVAGLRAHVEAGLPCFDCADIYTGVEDLLGSVKEALSVDVPATQKLRVHTKCVPDLDTLEAGAVNREYLELGIVRSLNRLKADALDLVQLHWWDYDVAGFVEAFASLCTLKDARLVREVGLTNTDLARLRSLVDAGHSVASNQVQLSLLDRRPLASGMAAFCDEHNIELLCYGSLAGGFLSERWLGKEDPGFGALENRSITKYRLIIDEYGSWEDFQRLLRLLADIASRRATNIPGVAAGWVLRQKGNTRVIMGARGAEHAKSAASSADVALSEDDVAALNKEVEGRGISGEVFGAERAGGRHTGIMRRNLNGIGRANHVAECLTRASLVGKTLQEASALMKREVELLKSLGNDVSNIEEALQQKASSPRKCPKLDA